MLKKTIFAKVAIHATDTHFYQLLIILHLFRILYDILDILDSFV